MGVLMRLLYVCVHGYVHVCRRTSVERSLVAES